MSFYNKGNDLTNFREPDKEILNLDDLFSKREIQIIKLISSGLTSKEIATKLFKSPLTVNIHRSNIINKLKSSKVSEIIAEFKENGYL
ncbi:MAG TPA: LuxR C-terminal-related transcriptional regulator [Flavobacterium sp.]|nr:LuxR C-terminal-related transcriptional regulator [Flavobacterium sp.]